MACTPVRPVCSSKKSAARRVGAVISSACLNHLRADDHWMRVSQACMNGGRIATCWSMFSGIVWLVPTSRMWCLTAEVTSPRPTMMCDWKWMTSGSISRTMRSALAFTRHGSMKRSQGCGSHRQL